MDVLVGLQYGDEGKGKIADYLTKENKYDCVARFQGGNNAGHTLYHEGNKIVLNHLPSGVLNTNVVNILGGGMVINPVHLKKEIENIKSLVPEFTLDKLAIYENAHIITPIHIIEDYLENEHIGTTLKGIGTCYRSKVTRKNAIRFSSLFDPNFDEVLGSLQIDMDILLGKNNIPENIIVSLDEFVDSLEYIRDNIQIVDKMFLSYNSGFKVLAEGAQGTMLDIDHGSYPFITTSTTLSSGALSSLGMPPQSIEKVYGVFKAYLTRVGNGHMETELTDGIGDFIAQKGKEVGASTGRPRRCGWLNLDELKKAVKLNGVTDLIMTKADILNGMDFVKMYHEGKYIKLHGWSTTELSPILGFFDANLETYITLIGNIVGCKITYVSTSPERDDIIKRY